MPVPLLIGGNGTRVLQLAGRVADIVGLGGLQPQPRRHRGRLTHFDAAGLDDRIAVVRDAAGDRFDAIELNALIQLVVHTDDREAVGGRAGRSLRRSLTGVPCWSRRSSCWARMSRWPRRWRSASSDSA